MKVVQLHKLDPKTVVESYSNPQTSQLQPQKDKNGP